MQIPKIIHQTWKEETLPYPFNILSETWKQLHPDWEYKLWTDDMNRNFIKVHYPDFLKKYDAYPKNIQRVDAFRYFLLHKYGGLYVDIDFECLKEIDPLLSGGSCVLGKEPREHCRRFHKNMILCNAFMAATPNNDFINFVCNTIAAYPILPHISPTGVLESTGPLILTNSYYDYTNKAAVQLLEPEAIYPLTMFETRAVFSDRITDEMQEKIDRSYAIHYFWGGW